MTVIVRCAVHTHQTIAASTRCQRAQREVAGVTLIPGNVYRVVLYDRNRRITGRYLDTSEYEMRFENADGKTQSVWRPTEIRSVEEATMLPRTPSTLDIVRAAHQSAKDEAADAALFAYAYDAAWKALDGIDEGLAATLRERLDQARQRVTETTDRARVLAAQVSAAQRTPEAGSVTR